MEVTGTVEFRMGDMFAVTGEPGEVAFYTFVLLRLIKAQSDHDAEDLAKKEIDVLNKLGNMTLEELMKRERDDEE